MKDRYTKTAFETAIDSARRETLSRTYYVTLWRAVSWYGGPEEGGWWGRDNIPEQTARFNTREDAETALRAVEGLAERMEQEAQNAHGDQCLRELEWLDERGLEADFLPEPDGPEEFFVTLSEDPPRAEYGERGYS